MHKYEKAAEQADYLVETARQRPEKLIEFNTSSTFKWKSIHQKLLEIYVEESKKETITKKLKSTTNLLSKLVRRDHLNTLVLNLYPAQDGYSISIKGRGGTECETLQLPYEETELLDYVDNEELPPILSDLLDKVHVNVFYSGCVVMEVRDYRRTTDSSCDTKYVLLKPTPHSMLCDINGLTNDGHTWSTEDKLRLEGELILATSEPLCLDPSPTAFFVANRLNFEKHKFNTVSLKRAVKKFSQAAVNRRRKMSHCSAPRHLKLHDFITKKKEKLLTPPLVNLKVGKSCIDMWKSKDIELSPPEEIEVEKYAKVLDKFKTTQDNTPVSNRPHMRI